MILLPLQGFEALLLGCLTLSLICSSWNPFKSPFLVKAAFEELSFKELAFKKFTPKHASPAF
jgi:hypothetical protein